MSDSEYQLLCEECAGICLACGEYAYGVEPDAEHYECESCGALKVRGIENCLISGNLDIESSHDLG